MKDNITNATGEALICEYINVAESDSRAQKSWSKKWGELLQDTLYVYPNSKPNTPLQNKYQIKDCEIHPAVKETGRILAFKIVNNDKVIVILEPLNIKDMGRWISSLFAAIQGVYSSNVSKKETTTTTQVGNSDPIPTTQIHHAISDEKLDFIVNVRSLAQKFEKLSTSEEPKSSNIKRTQSSPNLRHTIKRERDPDSDIIIIKSPETSEFNGVTLREKPGRRMEERKQETQRNSVRSYRGSYIEQGEEQQILSSLNNPALAKQKLVKQEQHIQRLEVTVKSVIERVERQKKALEETNAIIKRLKSQATGPEDETEISKLDEQRIQLQKQISQSEQTVNDYKENIQSIEQEMIQLSKYIGNKDSIISDNEPSNSNVAAKVHAFTRSISQSNVSTQDVVDNTLPTPSSAKNGSENGAHDNTSEISELSSEEEEVGMDKPAWAREALRKSKKAAKILRNKGILT